MTRPSDTTQTHDNECGYHEKLDSDSTVDIKRGVVRCQETEHRIFQ